MIAVNLVLMRWNIYLVALRYLAIVGVFTCIEMAMYSPDKVWKILALFIRGVNRPGNQNIAWVHLIFQLSVEEHPLIGDCVNLIVEH